MFFRNFHLVVGREEKPDKICTCGRVLPYLCTCLSWDKSGRFRRVFSFTGPKSPNFLDKAKKFRRVDRILFRGGTARTQLR